MTTTTSKPVVQVSEVQGGVGIYVGINPVPASRPRVTRWGVYYTKTYKNWMKDVAEVLPATDEPMEGNLRVDVYLRVSKPKTTKRQNPRGDIDNYLKAVFDAITKAGYWIDDDQIVTCVAFKEFVEDGVLPHFEILVTHV